MRIWNKIIERFYRTWLGNLYLYFLLWLDEKRGPEPVVPNHEVNQLVITAQQFAYKEGLRNMKKHVNSLVKAETKEEYQKVLSQIDNLIKHAKSDSKEKEKLTEALYKAWVFTGGRDIKSSKERAKMIEKRIDDYKELQEHKLKRKLMKEIRVAEREGNEELVNQLQKEWKEKYGQNSRRN